MSRLRSFVQYGFLLFRKMYSLREVVAGIVGVSGKEATVRINHLPKRSTLADANRGRKIVFFEVIYNNLFKGWD